MVTELEERVATLEATLEQALNIAQAHGDQHSSPEGSDPAPGFFIEVPTASDLPLTRPAPTLYKITGPPVLMYMVDPDGQRELGYSGTAQSSADVDFIQSDGTTVKDITGATITLPKPAVYVITGVFHFEHTGTFAGGKTIQGGVYQSDDTQWDAARARAFLGEANAEVTASVTIRISTSADDEVVKLRANMVNSVGINDTMTVRATHTTITAEAMLGGGTTSASHTHTHTQATGQTKGDHHTALTSLDIGGVPIVPDTGDAINLVAGANISLTPAPNELTITSTGGGGSGPHTLLSATHTDTDFAQLGSLGDVLTFGSNGWDNIAHPGVPSSFFISGGVTPQWASAASVAASLAAAMDHDQLGGLSDNDHVIYPTKNGVELITGLWQFDREVIFDAIASPSSPPINSGVLYTEVSGTDILLRWKSPTGDVCTICRETNTSITATVSFLMMGVKQV